MPVIDPIVFAALTRMSGEALVNAVIDVFLDEAPKLTAAMEQARVAGDVDTFRRSVHSLKSNADTFGATELAALSRELEAMARAGDLAVGRRMDDLRAACDTASAALRSLRT